METEEKARTLRHRVEIKLSEEQKALIARAAALTKQGLSEFVRYAAESAAREVVSRSER